MKRREELSMRQELSKLFDLSNPENRDFARVVWLALLNTLELLAGYELQVDDKSLENWLKSNQALEEDSVAGYMNHLKMLDVFYIAMMTKLFWPNMEQAGAPMAEKYAVPNLDRRVSLPIAVVQAVARKMGIAFIPTRQKDFEIKRPLQPDKLAKSGEVIAVLSDFLGAGAGHVIGITAEGKRNKKDALLLDFKSGLARLMIANPRQIVLPVAIQYLDNPKRVKVTVGEPFTLLELLPELQNQLTEDGKVDSAKLFAELHPDIPTQEAALVELLNHYLRGITLALLTKDSSEPESVQ